MKIPHCLIVVEFVCLNILGWARGLPAQTTSVSQLEAPASTTPSVVILNPSAARTADSVAILRIEPASDVVESYDIYRGANLVANARDANYTFRDLKPAQKFEFSVRAHMKDGSVVTSNIIHVATKPAGETFDITRFGAVGDGKTLNTTAIQRAIDACGKGGIVRIPAGVFVSGALFLKGEMTLHLDAGAVLMGSVDTKDYPLMKYRFEGRERDCYACLINTPPIKGVRWRDITIDGAGTINGSGVALRKKELREAAGKPGGVVCIRDTDGVYMKDVTVRQSTFWCVHPIYCSDVCINNVTINTRYDEAGAKYGGIVNGDGLDPDSCRDVSIFDCQIASEDDCISLKSGRDAEGRAVGIPTENVRISNCRFTSGFGVAMGSEMSGGLRNVLVEDCTFSDTFSLASVKAIRGRGSVIENITYRNCTMTNKNPEVHDSKWSRGAIYVDQFYGEGKFDPLKAQPNDESTPVIRNLLFQNITLDTAGGNAIYLSGLPESPLENVQFENVTAAGDHGFVANNVRGLVMDNLTVDARDGHGMRFIDVHQ